MAGKEGLGKREERTGGGGLDLPWGDLGAAGKEGKNEGKTKEKKGKIPENSLFSERSWISRGSKAGPGAARVPSCLGLTSLLFPLISSRKSQEWLGGVESSESSPSFS